MDNLITKTDLSQMVAKSAMTVSTGMEHTCVIRYNGFLQCWGKCGYGQCDLPNVYQHYTAVKSGGQFTCSVIGTYWNMVQNKQYYQDDKSKSDKVWCMGNDLHNVVNWIVDFNKSYGEQKVKSISSGYANVCAGFKQEWIDKQKYNFGMSQDDSDEDNGENFQPIMRVNNDNVNLDNNNNLIRQDNSNLNNIQNNHNIDNSNSSNTNSNDYSNNFQQFYNNTLNQSTSNLYGNYKSEFSQIQWNCWGSNNFGQNDIPIEINYNNTGFTDQFANTSSHIRDIFTGWVGTCALTGRGRVVCFGSSQFNKITPPQHLSTGMHKLTLGLNHTCGMRTNQLETGGNGSEISCWGSNHEGQGNVKDKVRQNGLDVCAGLLHTCALSEDGLYYCWGLNESGQCDTNRGKYEL